jgi:hypothetical protein
MNPEKFIFSSEQRGSPEGPKFTSVVLSSEVRARNYEASVYGIPSCGAIDQICENQVQLKVKKKKKQKEKKRRYRKTGANVTSARITYTEFRNSIALRRYSNKFQVSDVIDGLNSWTPY